mmetsp:Transcript_2499/g.3968  ORF Transcript_2499/g.3968 Transcript_2499/m.3968 type:complete len:481 (-) Transcript_2499:454-1896(-)
MNNNNKNASTTSTSPDKGMKKRPSPTGTPQRSGLATTMEQHQSNSNSSNATNNTNTTKGFLGSVLEQPPRKKCLTLPKEAVSNNGNDNSEGNLVVYENDIIQPLNVHSIKSSNNGSNGNGSNGNGSNSNDDSMTIGTLRVISLLGQGTFAQVFLCDCQKTGQRIALKVVKNKQAYTRQAAIEIDVFRALKDSKVNMVQLESYFCHENHLCLVFELLGLNLYDVLKRRQFRGLPLPTVRSLVRQAIHAVKDLSAKSIVHCDLKPENILLCQTEEQEKESNGGATNRAQQQQQQAATSTTPITQDDDDTVITDDGTSPSSCGGYNGGGTNSSSQQPQQRQPIPPTDTGPRIKLIDFGSACFEGNTAHTYIQSRFYRCPEVLVGLPYDSAIDMWSLGCVAAELFLGLPILPGVHEHDQLGRISEMIAPLPDWMLEQGSKSTKYFAKQLNRSSKEDPLKSVDNHHESSSSDNRTTTTTTTSTSC